MKIGIFGGAFNPVHNGHISLARQYMKYLELDKIIFIPTCVPPHKSGDDLAPGEDRINMLRCALDCEEFVISGGWAVLGVVFAIVCKSKYKDKFGN